MDSGLGRAILVVLRGSSLEAVYIFMKDQTEHRLGMQKVLVVRLADILPVCRRERKTSLFTICDHGLTR